MGTLEEIVEVVSHLSLGVHAKACGVLNIDGFWDPIISWYGHAQDKGFIWEGQENLLLSDDDPAKLLDALLAFNKKNHKGVADWSDSTDPKVVRDDPTAKGE